jgi:steroid delta-isomerase-like uncharacterized protein
MSNEEVRVLARQVIEAFNLDDIESLKEWFTHDFVWHFSSTTSMNKEQFLAFTHSIKEPFPDFAFTIEDIMAENDKVFMRLIATGTHQGVFQGIAPKNKRFRISGFGQYNLTNGKISEGWELLDELGELQQLGLVPTPGQ